MAKADDSRHRRFTESQIEAAKNTDLPELLASLGYTVRRIGNYHTTTEMDSIRIRDRRTWFRYSESVGGDAITWLKHFCGFSFPEAVNFLLDFNGYPTDSDLPIPKQNARPPPPRERPAFVLPTKHSDNEKVCSYLKGRGIARGVVDRFIKGGLLYEDAEHHDCVFVGRNKTRKSVFAAKRGIGDSFKGDVAGSDKKIAFRYIKDISLETVCVFESAIDLMSWLTLYGQTNAVALCGLYEGPLDTYLRENPGIKYIFLCLDADRRGKEAAERMKDKYSEQGYVAAYRPPPYGKDWNEYLQLKQ